MIFNKGTDIQFRNGAPIRLGDVAEVKVGHPPLIGDAVINDGHGILLIVEKQPWGNTLRGKPPTSYANTKNYQRVPGESLVTFIPS